MLKKPHFAVLLALALTIVPGTTFAATPTPKPAAGTTYCTDMESRITTVQSLFASDQQKRMTEEATEDVNLKAYRATVDAKLASLRAGWDATRTADFAKLATTATNASDQSAVNAFETSVTAAIIIKRSANDAATATFQSGQDAVIATRRGAAESGLTTRNAAIVTAAQNAEASCASETVGGGNVLTIRATFDTSVKSAQVAFKTADGSATTTYTAALKSLQSARSTTETSDYTTYRAAVNVALASLKSNWATAGISASPSPSAATGQ
jgi:hypothetical protein